MTHPAWSARFLVFIIFYAMAIALALNGIREARNKLKTSIPPLSRNLFSLSQIVFSVVLSYSLFFMGLTLMC